MSYSSTAANVAANKERHPELYCPIKRCLWRTGDNAVCCPKHKHLQVQADAVRANAAKAAAIK